MTNSKNNTKTFKNLESAFAGESMANRKYLYFAKLASELGEVEIAKLFEDTANQETGHAFSHLELLYPKKEMTVEKLLEIAMEGELYECTVMYPGFESEAIQEGQLEASHEFKDQGQESSQHFELFTKAAKRFGVLKKVEKRHADKYKEALKTKLLTPM